MIGQFVLHAKQEMFAFETITVSNAAIGPSAATAFPGSSPATYGLFSVETDNVRFRVDGASPTASVGHLLLPNQNVEIFGAENLKNLKFIRTNGDATIQASYGK